MIRRAVLSLALVVSGAAVPLVEPAGAADARAHSAWPTRERIVAIAKRYVGHARYVEGGASPRHGFDCSGFTEYVYAKAHARRLPHNAEAQRHLRGMRHISRKAARRGDLVFYLSGGSAYHVAIYAGHGMQYAAATPRDGIRYQKIWSRQVEFRSPFH
jgi:cell wall-associated NlpC family hydrolase